MKRKGYKKAFTTVAAASIMGVVSFGTILTVTGQTEKIADTVKSTVNKVLGKEEKAAVNGMFGDEVKSSESKVVQREKEGMTYEVKIPASQRVPIDEELANETFDGFISTEPVVKKEGKYTFTLYNYVTDGQSVCAYFSVEEKGGLDVIEWEDIDNSPNGKGVYWYKYWNFLPEFVNAGGDVLSEKTIVDKEKSTDEKYYLYLYGTWGEQGKEENPKLKLTMDGKTNLIELPKINTLKINSITQDGETIAAYSPISMKINLKAIGAGIDDVDKMEIKYKDGSVYTVVDGDEIDNIGYALGSIDDDEMTVVFNRVVDVNQVSEIVINDTVYPVN